MHRFVFNYKFNQKSEVIIVVSHNCLNTVSRNIEIQNIKRKRDCSGLFIN